MDVMQYAVMAASATDCMTFALESVACIFADIEDVHHPHLMVI